MLYAFQIKSCISEKNLKFFILQKVDTSREFEWKDLILTELLLVKCIFCQCGYWLKWPFTITPNIFKTRTFL